MKRIAAGILAHVDSGKTTLTEAMLYRSGNISKFGRVDHRDSFLDTFSLERDRGITIFSKQAVLEYRDTVFTLLDTPGHIDFSAEAERTLQVLDYAILVISAADGVQAHTKTLWKLLNKYRVPCFIFVNKTDLDGIDRDVLLHQLKAGLSEGCIDFTDTKDVDFFESLALCDDSLLTEYDKDGDVSDGSVIEAIKHRRVFPCLFGSALRLDGIDEFLSCFERFTVMPEYGGEFSGRVFKIGEDKQGGRLTYLKVTGGALKVKEVLASDKNTDGEKVNQIRIYSGEKFTTVNEAPAGTVCAVTGISFTAPGDGLGTEKNSVVPFLEPVLTYSMRITDGTDSHTALQKMKILENEDPMLKVVWNETLREIRVQLMGDIQLEILKDIIKQRFGIEAEFDTGSIIYKETIADTVEGVGHFEPLRHYAEVHLILKPLPRGSGLRFKSQCKEDSLDKNWQRLILTHLHEKTHIGTLVGAPITDIEITLASGKAHPKHTEGGDFRQATYRAVRQGLRSAVSVLLEPIYDFVLEVPNENVGRALSDIQRMSGSFEPPEAQGEYTVITGTAPVSEMSDYSREVTGYTHGTGKLACTLKGYDECHNTDEVVSAVGYNCDADTENTADSVFCSHGAGYNVKWNEVKSRMHLPSALSVTKSAESEKRRRIKRYKDSKDLFALDKELMQIFEQTYGPIKSKDAQSAHFTFTESAEKKKPPKPSAPKYEGPEYLLVDGYNVIFSWDSLRELSEDSIDAARLALQNILCNYRGYKKCEVILVFDAYRVKGNVREVEEFNGISIVYTKEAETADMYIEKVSHKLSKKHKVRVVTSDALEQLIILGGGALRVSSREFQSEVEALEQEIRDIINSIN
ncbi:MAG: TetM/TetW/TetO/TetS family tetracycline resistance ribosomal protection protein [Eubacterium sp.]|nr:TetM/TetW/TetO/TetS family tetracycline resistance ribosomal protection protein [Eubacterium sp.]